MRRLTSYCDDLEISGCTSEEIKDFLEDGQALSEFCDIDTDCDEFQIEVEDLHDFYTN